VPKEKIHVNVRDYWARLSTEGKAAAKKKKKKKAKKKAKGKAKRKKAKKSSR
jgi:hypothetical protein